jgi:hypothetical protein
MGWTCSSDGRDKAPYKNVDGKCLRKQPPAIPRKGLEVNITMDHERMELVQDIVQWRNSVLSVLDLRVILRQN